MMRKATNPNALNNRKSIDYENDLNTDGGVFN